MSILTAVKDIERLQIITRVLIRHGFGAVVQRLGLPSLLARKGKDEKADEAAALEEEKASKTVESMPVAVRLRLVLQELGPTFVKLGQIISTRPDIIPADLIIELKKLQDDVPPFSEEEARGMIQQCLGAPVEEIFTSFEAKPLAGASIAQVHRATLAVEGREAPVPVAIKVQRPGIDEMVRNDLNLLHMLASLIERAIPESRVYSPTGLIQEFDQAISAELDFTIEAINATRFAENFAEETALHFPAVFKQASGKKVLTLEFLDGLKVDEAVERGADRQWIAETGVRLILKMVFEDRFFHADPHPGNILIMPRPEGPTYEPRQVIKLGVLDLGLVGRLSRTLRDQVVDLLMAAARNDAEGIADVMLTMGRPRGTVDYQGFRRRVQVLCDRHLNRDLGDIDASTIMFDVVSAAVKYKLEIPVELTMILRSVMTIEGVGKEIYPELDLLKVAKPYLTRIVVQRYNPQKMGNELLRSLARVSTVAKDLPMQLQTLMEDMHHGRLRVQISDEQVAKSTERAGSRVRAALVSTALLGGGTALLAVGTYEILGVVMLTGAVLWMSTHLTIEFWENVLGWWKRRKQRR